MRQEVKKPRWLYERGDLMSHREVAERMGISEARAQQIENNAIRKLRKACDEQGITWLELFGK
jgi:DNA-directed RNA polymerase sigma subunit (sigma70/sigma32)